MFNKIQNKVESLLRYRHTIPLSLIFSFPTQQKDRNLNQ